MKQLLLHPQTEQLIQSFLDAPSHALLLSAPAGSGKKMLALNIAENLLQLPDGAFNVHPYTMLIESVEAKAIGIESVRSIEQFLSLKVPGGSTQDRIVVIDGAHLLSIEAQNALLKVLEEPPTGTILILTTISGQALLPTIRSRAQSIAVGKLDYDTVTAFFTKQGHPSDDVKRALAVSGGLPGLMNALLNDTQHPLSAAIDYARQLLSQPAFQRLATVDQLAKDRILARNTAMVLQRMAHISLQNATGAAEQKWRGVLTAGYEADKALAGNVQPKLVLTMLMLSL